MDPYTNRQQKACELLREAGFDKAIIGDPMSIMYLTGAHVIPYERFYGLILDAKGGVADMVNPSLDVGCAKGSVPEHTYADEDGPLATLKELIAPGETVAVEVNYFSMARGYMFEELGVTVRNIGDCLAKLRMHKDEAELENMRFADHIVDDALTYVSDKITVGMTEKELYNMLYNRMLTFPGFCTDEVVILALAGAHSANCHGVSGDYKIQQGDVILIDFCAYYNYYWSDITRCFFLGEPNQPKLKEIYEIVRTANETAIAAVKPGMHAKDIDKAARDVIAQAGYGEFFLHRTGHGLGLSVHEEPYITSVNDIVLEEGMTFTIEPGIYLEGIGGIRIEDDILVTHDGCEVLTRKTPKTIESTAWQAAE